MSCQLSWSLQFSDGGYLSTLSSFVSGNRSPVAILSIRLAISSTMAREIYPWPGQNPEVGFKGHLCASPSQSKQISSQCKSHGTSKLFKVVEIFTFVLLVSGSSFSASSSKSGQRRMSITVCVYEAFRQGYQSVVKTFGDYRHAVMWRLIRALNIKFQT